MMFLCIIIGFIITLYTKSALLSIVITILLYVLIKLIQHSFLVWALKRRYNILNQTGILELEPISEKYISLFKLSEKYLRKMESKLWWDKPAIFKAYELQAKKSYFSGYGDLFSNSFKSLIDTYPIFCSIRYNQEFYYLYAKYKRDDWDKYLLTRIFTSDADNKLYEKDVLYRILTEELVEITDLTDKAIYDKIITKYAPKVISVEEPAVTEIPKKSSQDFYAKRLDIKIPEPVIPEESVEEIVINKVSEKYL